MGKDGMILLAFFEQKNMHITFRRLPENLDRSLSTHRQAIMALGPIATLPFAAWSGAAHPRSSQTEFCTLSSQRTIMSAKLAIKTISITARQDTVMCMWKVGSTTLLWKTSALQKLTFTESSHSTTLQGSFLIRVKWLITSHTLLRLTAT